MTILINGSPTEAAEGEGLIELDLVAKRFAEIKAKDGAAALGFIASSKCTNEESFLMQKLSRAVIGTNNVDNCSS